MQASTVLLCTKLILTKSAFFLFFFKLVFFITLLLQLIRVIAVTHSFNQNQWYPASISSLVIMNVCSYVLVLHEE